MSDAIDLPLVAVRILVFGLAILIHGRAVFDLYAPLRRPGLVRRLAMPLGLLAAASGYILLLAREAADGARLDLATVVAIYADTGFGMALAAVQSMAVGLAIVALSRRPRRRARLVLAGLVLVALAFVGHAADDGGPRGALRVLVLAAHLTALGAWLGALPGLWQSLRAGDPPLAVIDRFARIGGASVAVVVATGLMSLAFVLADVRGAPGLGYLQALAAKLVFVSALLGVAALNRFVITPRLAHDPDRGRRTLRATIVLEQALGLGALASVALLGQLDPSM